MSARYRTERHNVMGLRYTERVRDVTPRQVYWVRSGGYALDRIMPVTVYREHAPESDGRVIHDIRYMDANHFDGFEMQQSKTSANAADLFPTRTEALTALKERAARHVAFVQRQIEAIDSAITREDH